MRNYASGKAITDPLGGLLDIPPGPAYSYYKSKGNLTTGIAIPGSEEMITSVPIPSSLPGEGKILLLAPIGASLADAKIELKNGWRFKGV